MLAKQVAYKSLDYVKRVPSFEHSDHSGIENIDNHFNFLKIN